MDKEWVRVDNWTNHEALYRTKIGDYMCEVNNIITTNKPDHWCYSIIGPMGFLHTGNSSGWSSRRAMDFVVLTIALRAFATVLTGKKMKEDWYDENTLDRV